MFFLNAGFFTGVTIGGGEMWMAQKNQWNVSEGEGQQARAEQKLQESGPWQYAVDFFIGGEAKIGQHHIWSHSFGIGYAPFVQEINDRRVITFSDGFISMAPPQGDQYKTSLNYNAVLQGRSMFGFMSQCRYFLFGLSGMVFNVNQTYTHPGGNEPVSKWHGVLGPCMSVKVNLAPHFRFVCYGEMLFASWEVKRDVVEFNEGPYRFTVNSAFKPTVWKVTAGFEVHFTKMHECSADRAKKPCDVDRAKEKRIEQLRAKVLGKCHSAGYYKCPSKCR